MDTRARTLLTLLAALLLAACGDDTTPEEPLADAGDTTADMVSVDTAPDDADTTGPDTAPGDADASEVEPDTTAASCGDELCEADESATCPEDCADGPVWAWDPFGEAVTAFPDDYFTVDDATTTTGLRVDFDAERVPGLDRFPEGWAGIFSQMESLDGFGTSAPIFVRFGDTLDGDAMPDAMATLAADSPLTVGWLDAQGALHRVPVRIDLVSYGRGMLLRPLVPLPQGTRAVVAVKKAALGKDGAELATNSRLVALLNGTATAPLDRLAERYAQAADALVADGFIASTDELAALNVYTTQSARETGVRLGELVAAESFGVTGIDGCVDRPGGWRRCDFTIETPDVRDAANVLTVPTSGPLARHELPVVAYVPTGPGPFPVMVFGHGLGGDRTQAELAATYVEQGWALVAIDAPGHGEHPDPAQGEQLEQVLSFFGVELLDGINLEIDPRIMAGSFVQAVADKLALEQALAGPIDLDGDGQPDLEQDRLAYLGISLGAIMGPQFLALSERVGAAVLVAGGGRLVDVLVDGEASGAIELVIPPELTQDDRELMFVYLQTAIELADGVNFAAIVGRDRLDGRAGVHTMASMAIGDEVVPNSTTLILARTLGGVQVEPALLAADTLPVAAPPIAANVDAETTVGLVQIDWINDSGQPDGWELADHQSVGPSTVGLLSWGHFLASWRDTGTAEIVDPWQALGLTPPR